MYFADAHNDLASYTGERPITQKRLLAAKVRVQVYAVCCTDITRAHIDAVQQIDKIHHLFSKNKASDFLSERNSNAIINEGQRYLISIEGAECLAPGFSKLDYYLSVGVGIIGLTWNNNNLFCGNSARSSDIGVTNQGIQLIKALNHRRVPVDLSHASERAFLDAIEIANVCMASHSNASTICKHPRNLTDRQIKMLIDQKGYMGICFYPPFLGGEGGIEEVYAHIDHVLSLGGERLIGFGSDFNGMDITSESLNSPTAFEKIIHRLSKAGYSERTLHAIAHKNLEEFLSHHI